MGDYLPDWYRESYMSRMRARQAFLKIVAEQEREGCAGPCDKCPLGSTVNDPEHFRCTIPLMRKVARLLIELPPVCTCCGAPLTPAPRPVDGYPGMKKE